MDAELMEKPWTGEGDLTAQMRDEAGFVGRSVTVVVGGVSRRGVAVSFDNESDQYVVRFDSDGSFWNPGGRVTWWFI